MAETIPIGLRIRRALMAGKDAPALEHAAILEELYGQKCQCGKRKAAGASFCPKCVREIPAEIYRGLLRGGYDYDAFYSLALGVLHHPVLKKRAKVSAPAKE